MESKTILSNCNYADEKIGNKLEDFTILQVMGMGSFGFVAKVRSKINLKIYALKKNIYENMNDKEKKKLKNEILFLNHFNHQNVCKCLSCFEEDKCLYIVMDLYNNKDLFRYLSAYISLNIKIKEEKLWDIFAQCLEGLTYIHNMGVIHRDIKPANLLMDNNGKIVIGDLGVSVVKEREEAFKFTKNEEEIKSLMIDPNEPLAGTQFYMAPEIEINEQYDQKADVYSMGICFYVLCFFGLPYYPPNNNMNQLYQDNYYSKELKEVIIQMIQINPVQRPTSSDIYKIFKMHYIRKYMKNSGICSAVRCLFAFPNFYKNFEEKVVGKIVDSQYKKKFVLVLIEIKSSFESKKELGESIYNLRKILYEEGIKIKDNLEIFPSSAIKIIINSLNYELNEISPKVSKFACSNKSDDKGDEKSKYEIFKNNYGKYFKSLITRAFQGVLKVKRICKKCQMSKICFERFHFINFDLNNLGNQNNINIYDLFISKNKTIINLGTDKFISCPNCKIHTDHTEQKTIYNIKKNLIILFNRGLNNKNTIKIDFNEKLKFDKSHVENINKNEYLLYGIIFEKYNKYYSVIKNNNIWILYNDSQENSEIIKNFNDIKNMGNIISLFYYDPGFQGLFPENNSINNSINKNFKNNKTFEEETNIVLKKLKDSNNNRYNINKDLYIENNVRNNYNNMNEYNNNNMNNYIFNRNNNIMMNSMANNNGINNMINNNGMNNMNNNNGMNNMIMNNNIVNNMNNINNVMNNNNFNNNMNNIMMNNNNQNNINNNRNEFYIRNNMVNNNNINGFRTNNNRNNFNLNNSVNMIYSNNMNFGGINNMNNMHMMGGNINNINNINMNMSANNINMNMSANNMSMNNMNINNMIMNNMYANNINMNANNMNKNN